jgi:hypothetical protein
MLKPWRWALRDARALPRCVRGPVLDRALFRFAASFAVKEAGGALDVRWSLLSCA